MSKWVIQIVIATFFFLFIFEAGYFGVSLLRSVKLQFYGVRTVGTVVGLVPEQSCSGTKNCIVKYNYRQLVSFKPKGIDKSITIKDPSYIFDTRKVLNEEVLKSRYHYFIGRKVTIVYDQNYPLGATVASAIWQETFLSTVLLLITIGVGLMIWMTKKTKSKKTTTHSKTKTTYN